MNNHALLAEVEVALSERVREESPGDVRQRALLAIEKAGTEANVVGLDAGVGDWSAAILKSIDDALRKELCDPRRGRLKDEYNATLQSALDPKSVARVAAVVLSIIQTINPVLHVSSIGIYIAIWLLKLGLNYWCSVEPPGEPT